MIAAIVNIDPSAAAVPKLSLNNSVKMAIGIVFVRPENRIIVELNSLMVAIQLRIAPEITPGSIKMAVTLKNVFTGEIQHL